MSTPVRDRHRLFKMILSADMDNRDRVCLPEFLKARNACVRTGVPINFSNRNLSFMTLGYADFTGANLSYSNISEVLLNDSLLEGANLRGSNLSSSWLDRANFKNADLRDANLSNVEVEDTQFQGANLKGVLWGNTNIIEANLPETDRFLYSPFGWCHIWTDLVQIARRKADIMKHLWVENPFPVPVRMHPDACGWWEDNRDMVLSIMNEMKRKEESIDKEKA